MLSGGCALTVGVGVIVEVIRKNNSDYDPDVGPAFNTMPSGRDPIYLGTLLRMFAESIPAFMSLILDPDRSPSNDGGASAGGGGDGAAAAAAPAPPTRRRLPVASGEVIEPLGFDRFKTCELMAELLHCSNMGLLNEPGSEQYVKQRDQERERLKAQGILPHGRDEPSNPNFVDDVAAYNQPTPGVHHEPGSLETSRRLEVANAGEDDGFEDILISDDFDDPGRINFADHRPRMGGNHDGAADSLDLGPAGPDRRHSLDETATSSERKHSPTRSPADPRSGSDPDRSSKDPSLSTARPSSSPSPPSPITSVMEDLNLDGRSDDTIQLSHPHASEVPDAGPVADRPSSHAETSRVVSPIPPGEPPPSPYRQALSPTSPPTPTAPEGQPESDRFSSHPEDHPAPLFSRLADSSSSFTTHANDDTGTTFETGPENSIGSAGTIFGDDESMRSGLTNGGNELESQVDAITDTPPVVGDYLKMMFVEHRVVPTILVCLSVDESCQNKSPPPPGGTYP